jgi:hypothetical protein
MLELSNVCISCDGLGFVGFVNICHNRDIESLSDFVRDVECLSVSNAGERLCPRLISLAIRSLECVGNI